MLHLAALPYPRIDPVLFRLGPLAVRWYGIAYLLAFLLGYLLLRRFVGRGVLRLPREGLADLTLWLIVGVLVGGRAGWWIFYHQGGGYEPWYEPLAIWHGGMSFHGGLVGVAVALGLWAWRHRAPFWNVADYLALIGPLGLLLGRIANFINAELVGRPTDLPWGMVFPGESVPRHPSQLYEAVLEGPLLLAILWLARWRSRLKDGQTAALFVLTYGVFRFAVEFTRQPDEQVGFVAFGWLTLGQLLSLILALAGLAVLRARARAGARAENEGSRHKWARLKGETVRTRVVTLFRSERSDHASR